MVTLVMVYVGKAKDYNINKLIIKNEVKKDVKK